MLTQEAIEGTEQLNLDAQRFQHRYNDLWSRPLTVPGLLHILKKLELVDEDFNVSRFISELANEK